MYLKFFIKRNFLVAVMMPVVTAARPQRFHVLTVLGTRPEAIKLAPLAARFDAHPDVEHALCSTGQHREMLDQVLTLFGMTPTHALQVAGGGGSLPDLGAAITAGVGELLSRFPADMVVVQGDTATALGGALAAYYRGIPIAHVEAGLRTGNLAAPWPEEGNRRMIGSIAAWHFAPTERAAVNLRAEGIAPARIRVTGNTGIDALLSMRDRLRADDALAADAAGPFGFLDPGRKMVLMTGHRRENFGSGLAGVFDALIELSRRPDVQIVYPVHLNPNVADPAARILGNRPTVHLIEPQPYHRMIHLMERAHLIITDSGGIQEEAPALGVPVLVTREVTERQEALEAGTALLVGTDTTRILEEAQALLDQPERRRRMAEARNPFGDGHAAVRIVETLVADWRASRYPKAA